MLSISDCNTTIRVSAEFQKFLVECDEARARRIAQMALDQAMATMTQETLRQLQLQQELDEADRQTLLRLRREHGRMVIEAIVNEALARSLICEALALETMAFIG